MSYREYQNRIELLTELIKKECTGTSYELADKLGISRRTVFEYISHVKDDGCQVDYDWQRRTYYFS